MSSVPDDLGLGTYGAKLPLAGPPELVAALLMAVLLTVALLLGVERPLGHLLDGLLSGLAVIRSMPVGMRTVASGPYWSWVLDENFYFCSSVLGRDCNSGCIGATLFALISIP